MAGSRMAGTSPAGSEGQPLPELAALLGREAEAFAGHLTLASGWSTSPSSYQGLRLSAEDDLKSGAQEV